MRSPFAGLAGFLLVLIFAEAEPLTLMVGGSVIGLALCWWAVRS